MSHSSHTVITSDFSGVIEAITFDINGLIPAIAQQYNNYAVLMMAWMNRDAVLETLTTGRACYWSRSRKRLWRKGEQSGQIQFLKELRVDCDGDTLLLLVDQIGVACHTGHHTCFYRGVRNGFLTTLIKVEVSPSLLYKMK